MALYTYIHDESPTPIWGLTSGQRIERVLKSYGEISVVTDLNALENNDSVLLFHGGYLFDDRIVQYLAATPGLILQIDFKGEKTAVAAHISAGIAHQVLMVMEKTSNTASLPGVRIESLDTLPISFQENLRKSVPPFILRVSEENAENLERRLYNWAYKGITDLVTKWVWPVPARWVVRQCVRFGIRPNQVTSVGFILVILAGILFYKGQYGWGLLAGWVMTFLDTVDGKLARVTVTSSRFGHYFDHIIDIVHPPFWYLLWGLGLPATYSGSAEWLSLAALIWAIFIGYTVGRLTELLFRRVLAGFEIFCWRPIDSYFRLITGRRNPNLLFLTAGFLLGNAPLGLVAVTFWTVLTSLFLMFRLGMATYARTGKEPFQSWLTDIGGKVATDALAVRIFTKQKHLS